MRAAILVAASLLAAGCAGAGETPDWLAQRSAAADEAYPDLHAVPRTHDANIDQAYWTAVEAEMLALGHAIRSNPRAAPAAQTESPTEFLEEAQRDLEETRQSHTP